MCRFLLVKSEESIKPVSLLNQFADISKQSRALNGDWQGDGWGVSWFDEESQTWQLTRSLKPIWEKREREKFTHLPKVKIFCAHARSATFETQMGDISYNQPYLSEDNSLSFVFNGHLKGVKLNRHVPGKSGAQKLWHILQENFIKQESALKKIKNLMLKNTREIQAMNIGLANQEAISALCLYKPNNKKPDYHRLWYLDKASLNIICSEPLANYKQEMRKLDSGEVLTRSEVD